MKKIQFLFFLFSSTLGFSQEYSFVSKDAIAIDKWKYIDLLNKIPKPEIDYRLENGKPYSQTYIDSLIKTKDSNRLKTIYLSDSIANKVTVILKSRTDAEVKNDNEAFFDLQKKDKKNRAKLLGSTINDVTFIDIYGKQHTTESMLGKMVFFNFWFTKCAPCIKEMPDLNKLKKKYGDENVLYFAITYDKIELVEKFLTRQQLDFTIIPNQQKTIDTFGINFFPTNILVDQKSKVIFVNELFNPKSNNGIDEIDKLIKKHSKQI
jgi:thiol-disulfide isomerase/thioredoxin